MDIVFKNQKISANKKFITKYILFITVMYIGVYKVLKKCEKTRDILTLYKMYTE